MPPCSPAATFAGAFSATARGLVGGCGLSCSHPWLEPNRTPPDLAPVMTGGTCITWKRRRSPGARQCGSSRKPACTEGSLVGIASTRACLARDRGAEYLHLSTSYCRGPSTTAMLGAPPRRHRCRARGRRRPLRLSSSHRRHTKSMPMRMLMNAPLTKIRWGPVDYAAAAAAVSSALEGQRGERRAAKDGKNVKGKLTCGPHLTRAKLAFHRVLDHK